MNKRSTSWLLAALMALCAAQAVPSVRARHSAESCSIVWIARARAEQRAAIEVRDLRHRSAHPRLAVPLPDEPRFTCSQSFSKSLYQRPPPFSLL